MAGGVHGRGHAWQGHAWWGHAWQRGLLWGGVSAPGVSAPGGLLEGGVSAPGVSAQGVSVLRQAPRERWLLLQMVRILLECILVEKIYLPPAMKLGQGKVIFSEACVKNSVHGGVT